MKEKDEEKKRRKSYKNGKRKIEKEESTKVDGGRDEAEKGKKKRKDS